MATLPLLEDPALPPTRLPPGSQRCLLAVVFVASQQVVAHARCLPVINMEGERLKLLDYPGDCDLLGVRAVAQLLKLRASRYFNPADETAGGWLNPLEFR